MEYRPLGRTGVQVSKLCLGTMMFGAWGNPDHDDSIRIIHRALDAGINFIDTADVYSAGESEEIVGKALKGRRDDVVLATKFFMPMGEDPNQRGGSRRWIVRAVEDSLRRLGTDYIDLYQVHRPSPRPTSRRRWARSPTSSARARSAPSATRRSPAARSSRRSGSRASAAWSASCTEQPPYSMLVARHRARRPARPRSATAWACSPTARSPAAGSRAAGRADSPADLVARQRLPRASTSRCPTTNASWTP